MDRTKAGGVKIVVLHVLAGETAQRDTGVLGIVISEGDGYLHQNCFGRF